MMESQSRAQWRPIWIFGGGKGGAGRSIVCAASAIELARRGQRVLAVDLGGSTLHTLLGVLRPTRVIDEYLEQRCSLAEVVVPTPIEGLRLIGGASAGTGMLDDADMAEQLFEEIRHLDADAILIDLGADLRPATLDIFNRASVGLVVSGTEPPAIQSTYMFIKRALFRRLREVLPMQGAQALVDRALLARGVGRIDSVGSLLEALDAKDPVWANRARRVLEDFRTRLVINQASARAERRVMAALGVVCRRYLDFDLPLACRLPRDADVRRAVRRLEPVLGNEEGPFAAGIRTLIDGLLNETMSAQPVNSILIGEQDDVQLLPDVPTAAEETVDLVADEVEEALEEEPEPTGEQPAVNLQAELNHGEPLEPVPTPAPIRAAVAALTEQPRTEGVIPGLSAELLAAMASAEVAVADEEEDPWAHLELAGNGPPLDDVDFTPAPDAWGDSIEQEEEAVSASVLSDSGGLSTQVQLKTEMLTVQTTDLAPHVTRIRCAIFRGNRLIGMKDYEYSAHQHRAEAGEVNALHQQVIQTLKTAGTGALPWLAEPDELP